MKDIETRGDIELLMRKFYERLLADTSVSYIFTDVAKIDLEAHLPHLADFWQQALFYTGSYRKNVMQVHLDLNAEEKLTEAHFDTWLAHFITTVDTLFKGETAEKAKNRALNIATIMKIKTGIF